MSETAPSIELIEISNFIGKIRLLVPGFKDYLTVSDITENNQIICKYLLNRLNDVKNRLDELRENMVDKNDFGAMPPLGSNIAKTRQMIDDVSKMQQDSSCMSPNEKIERSKLKNLYEYDYKLLIGIEQIFHSISLNEYSSEIVPAISIVNKLFPAITDFRQLWKQRLEKIKKQQIQQTN